MTDAESLALIDRVSHEVADSLRPLLHELERENDRLVGEMRSLRRRMTAERTRLEQEIADLGRQLEAARAQAAALSVEPPAEPTSPDATESAAA